MADEVAASAPVDLLAWSVSSWILCTGCCDGAGLEGGWGLGGIGPLTIGGGQKPGGRTPGAIETASDGGWGPKPKLGCVPGGPPFMGIGKPAAARAAAAMLPGGAYMAAAG